MSLLRARTQMIKHQERLMAKVLEIEIKRADLDNQAAALQAQITAIDTVLTTLHTGNE